MVRGMFWVSSERARCASIMSSGVVARQVFLLSKSCQYVMRSPRVTIMYVIRACVGADGKRTSDTRVHTLIPPSPPPPSPPAPSSPTPPPRSHFNELA